MTEYWNVSTRPIERNGYGLPNAEIIEGVEEIERTMVLLPDTLQVYSIWRQLVLGMFVVCRFTMLGLPR